MFDYNRQIKAYESDCVNLPQPVKDKLRGHRSANRDRLKRNCPQDLRVTDESFIPQGSMAIGTTVQEKDNAYDIDDGVWFYSEDLVDERGESLTAREVQELVRDALQDPKFNKEPKIKGNCVRVYYAEGHHVDVPAYRTFDAGTEDERRELAGESGWVVSDPTEINRWFENCVQELNVELDGAGSQLRRMIRLLKRFARSRGEKWDMPNGLKLTMLVEECYRLGADRDDEAFYNLLNSLAARLAVSLEVENRAQSKIPRDKLTKCSADENMIELRDHIAEALQRLSILNDPRCTRQQAREAWDWVFQSEGYFDAFDRDERGARSSFVAAALINAGVATTNRAGHIVAPGTDLGVPNLPHAFYGELPSK